MSARIEQTIIVQTTRRRSRVRARAATAALEQLAELRDSHEARAQFEGGVRYLESRGRTAA